MTGPVLPVPADRSVFQKILKDWNAIVRPIALNKDVEVQIASISSRLVDCETRLRAGKLDPAYLWDDDIAKARWLHEQNLQWMQNQKEGFDNRQEYWRDRAKAQYDIAKSLMLTCVGFLFAINSGVLFGSLTSLLSGKGEEFRAPITWLLFTSIIGMTEIVGSAAAIAEWLSDYSTKINRYLFGRMTHTQEKALGNFSKRFHLRKSAWASRLLYGNGVWIFFYVAVAFLWVINTPSNAQ